MIGGVGCAAGTSGSRVSAVGLEAAASGSVAAFRPWTVEGEGGGAKAGGIDGRKESPRDGGERG